MTRVGTGYDYTVTETIKANNKANANKNKNKPEILVAEVIRCGMTIPVRVRVTRVIVNEQACHGQGKVTEKKKEANLSICGFGNSGTS